MMDVLAWIFFGISAITRAESQGIVRSARKTFGTGMRYIIRICKDKIIY
jgi:hypothetical protein